jgi:hypothetical protein
VERVSRPPKLAVFFHSVSRASGAAAKLQDPADASLTIWWRPTELGFGSDMDAMIEFYWECGEELCTGYLRTRTYPRDWIYFCFTDAKNAEDFAGRFGGESLSPAEVSLFLPLNNQWSSKN